MIVVSSDEKKYVHKEFKKHVDIKIEHLPIGDFVIGNVIIERKEINDFYQSIADGRLYRQLNNLKEFVQKYPESIAMVLVEGNGLSRYVAKYKNVFNINQALIDIMLNYKVFVFRTNNLTETIKFAKELLKYQNTDDRVLKFVRGHKSKRKLLDSKIYALMGFPTIGEKTARKIINEYKTLQNFFDMLISQKSKYKKVKEVYTK